VATSVLLLRKNKVVISVLTSLQHNFIHINKSVSNAAALSLASCLLCFVLLHITVECEAVCELILHRFSFPKTVEYSDHIQEAYLSTGLTQTVNALEGRWNVWLFHSKMMQSFSGASLW